MMINFTSRSLFFFLMAETSSAVAACNSKHMRHMLLLHLALERMLIKCTMQS